jgi:hypothetical protein
MSTAPIEDGASFFGYPDARSLGWYWQWLSPVTSRGIRECILPLLTAVALSRVSVSWPFRVLGANVGCKLFVALQLEVAHHFIE